MSHHSAAWLLQAVGPLVASLEWLVFVCSHTWGAAWKERFAAAPWWAQRVMANGFKQPWGFWAIGALHLLPLWLYVQRRMPETMLLVAGLVPLPRVVDMIDALLWSGRALSAAVELWVLCTHIGVLLAPPEAPASEPAPNAAAADGTLAPPAPRRSRRSAGSSIAAAAETVS
jgi:hypothetical protein